MLFGSSGRCRLAGESISLGSGFPAVLSVLALCFVQCSTMASTTVLGQGFCSCTEHDDQAVSWRCGGRVYSAYTSTLLFITKGSQDRNSHRARIWGQKLMERPWRDAAYWFACSACFLIEPRTTSPGVAPPTMGPPALITN